MPGRAPLLLAIGLILLQGAFANVFASTTTSPAPSGHVAQPPSHVGDLITGSVGSGHSGTGSGHSGAGSGHSGTGGGHTTTTGLNSHGSAAAGSPSASGDAHGGGHASSASGDVHGGGHAAGHTADPKYGGRHVVPVPAAYEECYYSARPFEGLVFFFTGITIGTLVMFLTMLPMFHGIQQTVVIFVLGMAYALLGEYYELYKSTGMFGRSYCMWMNIDPHLLLFTILPLLLTGDAMAIDTSVARRVYRQCIHLAGPGVLFCSFFTALFLWWYLPYDWSFMMCLTVGSILAATDPVAVVNLLKELGASPTLTVQIQGESLLNDGTAIVLYSVTYKMLEGEEFATNDVVVFLLRVVLLAILVGALIGWFCTVWIRLSCRRLDHHSSYVQISITLLCAYWSYIFAEGLFGMSGVLTTVSSALVLADRMWPSIVSKESMDNAWHMFEFMGNTAIFFLAGSWTGNIMYQIEGKDYLHLFVLYLVLHVVRGVMLLLSLPILRMLGQDLEPVSLADTTVMCWGGLRGAVGLSLAIHMSIDRAGGQIHEIEGKRVLFFTSGIAALTLLVNATTCPLLVKWLGIAKTSKTRKTIMQAVHYQLAMIAHKQTVDKLDKDGKSTQSHEANELTSLVGQIMDGMLDDVHHHILDEQQVAARLSRILGRDEAPAPAHATGQPGAEGLAGWMPRISQASVLSVDDGPQLIMHYKSARRAHDLLSQDMIELLRFPRVPEDSDLVDELSALVVKESPNRSMHRVVREAFNSLLRAQYWSMNDRGEFLDDHNIRSCLLQSLGTTEAGYELSDLRFIVSSLMTEGDMSLEEVGYDFNMDILGLDSSGGEPSVDEQGMFAYIEKSTLFSVTMVCVILANTVSIVIELVNDDDPKTQRYMPVINLCFAIAYLFEFVIRFGALRWQYFCDSWNILDFILLLVGLVGSVLEFVILTEHMSQSQSARLARLIKLFRILRSVRIGMRVIKAAKSGGLARIDVTKGVGGVMLAIRNARNSDNTVLSVRYIHILSSFVKAHLQCQQQFVQYFGKHGKLESTEAARCLMASQTEVLSAIVMACTVAGHVEKPALIALNVLRESTRIAEELLHFVDDAHLNGILGGREAETLQHPMKAEMRKITHKLDNVVQGAFGIRATGFKDSLGWFRGALSLPPVMSMTSSGSKDHHHHFSRKNSMSSLDVAIMGLREKLSGTSADAESYWNVRVHQTLSAKSSGVASVASVASEMQETHAEGPMSDTTDLVSSNQTLRPCPKPSSPPPSMPPSCPSSSPGSPLASPRCPTPPPQDGVELDEPGKEWIF